MGLKIEICSKLKIFYFLNVTFNLNNYSFKPFNQSYNIPTLMLRRSLNKFPDFFRMGTFIDSTHMKL